MRAALASLLAMGASLSGCANLPEIPGAVCGNAIVEGTEECDGYAPKGQACRPPGVAGACRFDCSADRGLAPTCPDQSACGLDGLCHFATGEYQTFGEPVVGAPAALLLGDFEGDGRMDLVTVGQPNSAGQALLRLLFLDNLGESKDRFEPQIPIRAPLVLKLESDPEVTPLTRRTQLVFGTDSGLGTLRADADRSIIAPPYPLQSIPEDEEYQLLELRGSRSSALGEAPLLVANSATSTRVELASLPRILTEFDSRHAQQPPVVLAGDLSDGPDSPCEELLFLYPGQTSVLLYEPCDTDGQWQKSQQEPQPALELTGQASLGNRAWLARLDEDGHLDLVLNDSSGRPYVAWGQGDGTFVADPHQPELTRGVAWPLMHQDGDCPETEKAFELEVPLGVADLDGEGLADWVTPTGVRLVQSLEVSSSEERTLLTTCPGNSPFYGSWSNASVADLNRDQKPDVVAGSEVWPDLELLLGTGRRRMNRLSLTTGHPTRHLAVGDLDGDTIPDLAWVEAAQQGSREQGVDELFVAFSDEAGLPESSIPLARYQEVEQLRLSNYGTQEVTGDLAIVAKPLDSSARTLTLFMGDRERLPIASLGLVTQTDDGGRALAVPFGAVSGHFLSQAAMNLLLLAADQPETSDRLRLWMVTGSDSGELTLPVAGPLLPEEISVGSESSAAPGFALTAGKLDGDARDEVLMLAATQEPDEVGLWQLDPQQLDQGSAVRLLSTGKGTILPLIPPALVDVDGDGWNDLLAVLDQGQAQSSLLVVKNRDGELDLSSASVVDLQGESVRGFAWAEPQGQLRLAAITGKAAYDLVADLEKPGRLLAQRVSGIPGGNAVALGDLTGDGLLDWVVATDEGIQIFAEKPRQP